MRQVRDSMLLGMLLPGDWLGSPVNQSRLVQLLHRCDNLDGHWVLVVLNTYLTSWGARKHRTKRKPIYDIKDIIIVAQTDENPFALTPALRSRGDR
jgi:hypothetical protein